MASPKRRRPSKITRKGIYKRSYKRAKTTLKKQIQSVVNRNIETKQSCFTNTDGVQIIHNNFQSVDNTLLSTSQGTADPGSDNFSNRVGDQVTIQGVTLKMMLELNERYTDVTCRILVVKSSRGDTPTRATLFRGLSQNKMLDTLNTERYSIVAQKYVKLRPSGIATVGPSYNVLLAASGSYLDTGGQAAISRATKMVSMYIPGKKFGRNGKVTYDSGGTTVKFFDYNVFVYAYANYSTAQDVFDIARVNDYIKIMKFKDA